MSNWLRHRLATGLNQDEQGQGLVEYALILLLIAVACVGAVTTLGQQIVATLYEPVISVFGG